MMREHINYGKTLTVSQLQLSEQPADAPHMLGNRAQSFLSQLSCLIATGTEIESIACLRSLAVLAHYRNKMSPNDGLGSL